jgi:hypothetical protein
VFRSARKWTYRIVIIPGAGHAFIDPERRALMPGFVEALRHWLVEHAVQTAPDPPELVVP